VPLAQRLDLGWVIVGEACLDGVHKPKNITAFKTQIYNGRPSLFEPCPNKLTIQHNGQPQQCNRQETFVQGKFEDRLARNVFALTAEDNKPGLWVEDKRFVEIMEQNMTKNKSGNWTSPLPSQNLVQTLPNSRDAALKRLKSTCQTLSRKPLTKQHYLDFMQQVLDKELAELAPPDDLNSSRPCWYLPHFGVYHPQKPEKIRVVFDSAAETNGISLNKLLPSGPDLTNSLSGVLLRFRQNPQQTACTICWV
jgi:hypothetical protein